MAPKRRPIGMALWLLRGGRLVDRVAWCVQHGFGSVALLQHIMRADPAERADAAAAIRAAGLAVTYHGNVHEDLRDGSLDESFVTRMADDVLWWHENAGGVHSCCSDPIHTAGTFDPAANHRLLELLGETLGTRGIRVGIENSFGPNRYQSVDDIATFARRCAGIPGLAILLDTGHVHVHLRGRPGIGDYIRALPLPLAEVHVTDNHGEKDEHKARGTLNLADLAQALADIGYSGPITVEVCVDILSKKYTADIADAEETAGALEMFDRLRAVFPDTPSQPRP